MEDRIDNNGMVLAEILLAGAVISIALASSVIIIGNIQMMLVGMQKSFEAQLITRNEIVLAHLTTFSDLVSFEKNLGEFSFDYLVKYRNSFTKNIEAKVSWFEGPNQKHRMYTDQIVDWKNAFGAEDCDWLDNSRGELVQISLGALDVDNGNLITGVAASGNFVYVSADSATSSLPDLYVIDVHDIQNPKIVSQINTGPGIASIAIAGGYIFVANAGSYQMQVISVVDPTQPVLVSQAKLPGSVISGTGGFGNVIHYFNKQIFIGLNKNAGPEFYIVDVSNPQAPIFLGSYEIGSSVNDIDVSGGKAVVVTPGQLSVLSVDISNPTVISEISHTTLNGWQTQGSQSVEMFGEEIIVGRTLGGFYSPNPELVSVSSDLLISTSTTNIKINASIENIFAFNDYLYVVTSDPDKAFEVIHKTKDGFEISTSSRLSSRGVVLTCNNKAMYVVTQNYADFFHIYSLP